MASLKVNDTFHSYQALTEAIERYENEHRVQFWKRDAKKIKSAEHHAPKICKAAKQYPELEYYYLKFSCIHGGQIFRPYSSISDRCRKNHGTWKQECKAEISVNLSKDKNALIISHIVHEHNHEIPSVEEFQLLPKQRKKLNDDNIEGSKKQLKKVKERNNKEKTTNFVLKNLLRTNSSSRSKNFKKIATILKEKYNCEVTLEMDEEDKVFGFFFQDPYMKTSFEYFPEVLYIDGTYHPLNISCCIYMLWIENSFGATDIVGVAVLTVVDGTSVQWMIEKSEVYLSRFRSKSNKPILWEQSNQCLLFYAFKEANPAWNKTKFVVMDKSTSEHQIIQEEFPRASALICQYHAFQILKNEMKPPKLMVTHSEIKKALQYIERLMCSSSPKQYNDILEEIVDQVPYSIVEYFYRNWHESRCEWSKAFTKQSRVAVNCKLENKNSKLKAVIGACRNFNEFVEKLFTVLKLRRQDLKSELVKTTFKTPKVNERNKLWVRYKQCLTLFAFTKIEPFLLSEKAYHLRQEGSKMICKTQNKKLYLTETSCICHFFTSLRLPCKHVLFYRRFLNMTLFDETLFAERWTKRYAKIAFGDLLLNHDESTIGSVTESRGIKRKGNVLEVAADSKDEDKRITKEKIEEVREVCSTLAKLCNEVPSSTEFMKRMNLLIQLKSCWENRRNVAIVSDEVQHFKIVENPNGDFGEDIRLEVNEDHVLNDHNYSF